MARLPSTGIFTSFCASIPPNHWLKLIVFGAVYFNYLAIYFPFLLPTIRITVLLFPFSHTKVNKHLTRYMIPLLTITPICFTFYLIPALGVCRQRAYPLPFGSLWIHFIDSAFGLTNRYFHLYNLIFWMTCSLSASALLFYQLAKARSQMSQNSDLFRKANHSVSITTTAMIVFYMTNGAFLITFILYYDTESYSSYAALIRQFGNDLQFCVVTWVFYLTHPSFRTDYVFDEVSASRNWLNRRPQ
uniref:Serpentine receptor class gamma n=1 Tax=Caenorhabditis tropicalis TaxID=1561998 RepID=A0A1I7UDE6_9PELO